MKKVFKYDYDEILKGQFTYDVIKDFGNFVMERLEKFIKATIFGIKISDYTNDVSTDLINATIVDMFADMCRIKSFHPVVNPTTFKYAGYLGYWWLKRKPIGIKNDIKKINPALNDDQEWFILNINEFFMVHLMYAMVFSPKTKDCHKDKNGGQAKEEFEEIQKFFVYFLIYRITTPQSLEMFLRGICSCPMYDSI